MVPSEYAVAHEGCEFQVTICDVRSRWCPPYLELSSYPDCEVFPIRGEDQGIYFAAEREVVEHNATGYIGEYRVAVEVDGEKKIASRIECESSDVFAMCKGKCV